MQRAIFMIQFLLAAFCCTAQRELIKAKDPTTLRTAVFAIKYFDLPEGYGKFAGIRFADGRHIKAFAGFVQQLKNGPYRKLSTTASFEEELNTAVKIKKDSSDRKDSMIVLLKKFWIRQAAGSFDAMQCHAVAWFFIKTADSFLFHGKLDTVFVRRAIVRHEYKDLPLLFMEDLLQAYHPGARSENRGYRQQDFERMVNVGQRSIADTFSQNGLFLSFADFCKGHLYPAGISLVEFYDAYKIFYSDEVLEKRMWNRIWGVFYNGQLYIRDGRYFNRAFAADASYIMMRKSAVNDDAEMLVYPVALNMDTGLPE